ncbi:hypothetical protein C6P40_005229, partial [Pichia californica]
MMNNKIQLNNNEFKYYKDIENEVENIINDIPKGYFIGLNNEQINIICSVLYYLINKKIGNKIFIDIGSGKGYIDRIISSIYKIPIICIDEIKERLNSTIKLQKLLNDDKIKFLDDTINGKLNKNLMLIKTIQYKIKNDKDFKIILNKGFEFAND